MKLNEVKMYYHGEWKGIVALLLSLNLIALAHEAGVFMSLGGLFGLVLFRYVVVRFLP